MKIKENLTEICFQNGYGLLKNQDGVALIGISLGNGYFNSENINLLVSTAVHLFKNIAIIVPDLISIHNYKAIGFDQLEAEKIVDKKARIITNRCMSALKNIPEQCKKPDILNWQEIKKSVFYQDQLISMFRLYGCNTAFRDDLRDCTKQVIVSKILELENVNLDDAINEGTNYLIKEIAFLMAGSQMFNCKQVAFVYHKNWPFLQNFINGKYDGKIKNNIAYIIIN